MKLCILLSTLIMLLSSFTVQTIYVDPTGTYKMDSKTKKKNGNVYGYSGSIQVKKITVDKIVMVLGVNKGAPSYNSGSIIDTLIYKDNRVVYKDVETDSTCRITFDFDRNGIRVKEETADYNSGCGFGHAVVADGFYKKISGRIPVLIHPLTGEKIEK